MEIDDSGGTQVYMTKSLDPMNGSWLVVFPSRDDHGRAFLPYTVTSTPTTITNKGQYYDDKGRLKSASSVCTKTS